MDAIDRVLIVGSGSIARLHARVVREELPDAKIQFLRSRTPPPTASVASETVVTTLDAACAFRPQVSIVANAAPWHVPTALALLESGSDVLIEKPVATTINEAVALIRCASERGAVAQVGYNLRFLPSLERFRELVRGGRVGRIQSVRSDCGQYLPTWRQGVDYRETVSARRELGGGVLLELSHEFDYLRWVFGEVVWANAWSGRRSQLEIDVEDTVLAILGVGGSDGAVISLNLDCTRHDSQRCCLAVGDDGTLRWDARRGEVSLWSRGASGWDTLYSRASVREDSYRTQWVNFLGTVRTRGTPAVTASDGLAALAIAEACRHSADGDGSRVLVSKCAEPVA